MGNTLNFDGSPELSFGQPGWSQQGVSATSGGQGMDPILTAALVETAGGLLKGLFGGMGRKAKDKREWDKFMKRMTMIKPEGKYSRGVDPVTEQAIMNMFATRGMQAPAYGGG